jgi:YhcG PDDEXK nuclease domain
VLLLVDLKLGKLTHQDVGQMDTYVRIYDEQHKGEDDNPTIGLILCSEKSTALAKYSVLADKAQLFAAKYVDLLPTEAELRLALLRERAALQG